VVTVRDTGIGLAADQIQAVFDVFRQVDTTIERAHGGLGIGLTLVEKITAMHDGRVEVESAGLGQGCTFRVCLPRQRVAPTGALAASVTNAAAADTLDNVDASRRGTTRILVVDDNRDAADTLAMMVRVLGHEVAQVYDPLQVEAEVERFAPDLVFLDVGMPGRSGYDIARSLRKKRDPRAMGIVAVTGWGQPEDRERTRAAGFDEHLVKPPQLDAIRRLCAGAGTGRDTDT
jgi:CheY-like chemotaxis protein